MINIFAEEDNLDTTVYEKSGFNSLDDYFKSILEMKKSGNDEEVSTALSKLNAEEKEAFIDWAHADTDFPELVKVMIRGNLNKLSFDINEDLYNKVCTCLMSAGLTVVKDSTVVDNCVPYSVEFTDNNLIEGNVDYHARKVHLNARDAYGRAYDKTIDYICFDDLIESIYHFQKDITETYEKYEEEHLSEDWTNILKDKEFMASIGAEDIVSTEEK